MLLLNLVGLGLCIFFGVGSIVIGHRLLLNKRDALAYIWAISLALKFNEVVDRRYLTWGYQRADTWLFRELPGLLRGK